MADDRDDDVASMVFEDDSPQPSRYMKSILSSSPGTRRAQTINLDNPHNRAVAFPAYHIGIDAKDSPPTGGFKVRMAKLNDVDSQSLASTAAGRPNTYRPRAVVAAERREKIIASSSNSKGKNTPVNLAPGHTNDPAESEEEEESTPRTTRRRAAVAGKKKRKRVIRGDSEDEFNDAAEVGAGDDSQEGARVSKKRVAKRKTTGSTVEPQTLVPVNSTLGFGPSSLLRKRDGGIKVPKTLDDACEADRMLWEWRHGGKPWAGITRKWTELTGKTPGKSTLSVRFIKLSENFAHAGGADDIILLQYKADAEAEMENELWQKVSDKIKTNHDVEIPPNQLRKRYNALRQSGFEIGGELEAEGDTVEHADAVEDAGVLKRAEITEGALLVDYSNSESDV